MASAAQNAQQSGPSQSDMALQLLSITNDLTRVLTDESAALTQRKTAEVDTLSKRKTDLFSAYGSAMQSVQALGHPKLAIDTALKTALREATFKFKAELERNQRLLKAQLDLSQGMMKTIGKEVERQQNPIKTYGNPGENRRKKAPTSIALNQTI